MKEEIKKIKLTKEMKVKLLLAIQSGYIDANEFREILDISQPVFQLNLISSGIPLASSEDEIVD
jgi:hypothetical protein